MVRRLASPLRPLPSTNTGLPRLRDPLSRRAVPITPVDRSGASVGYFPKPCCLPHSSAGSTSTTFPFEACSGFTHVTARRFARPPKAAFVAGLRSSQLLNQTACQLPGQPTIARVGLPPTRLPHPIGAHEKNQKTFGHLEELLLFRHCREVWAAALSARRMLSVNFSQFRDFLVAQTGVFRAVGRLRPSSNLYGGLVAIRCRLERRLIL